MRHSPLLRDCGGAKFFNYIDFMLEIFKRAKKRILFIIFLLVANAFITFSGFVAYTSEERRACDLIKYIESADTSDERAERLQNLSKTNKELVFKYLASYTKLNFCTSIEKFIVNEFVIIFFGVILVLIKKKDSK